MEVSNEFVYAAVGAVVGLISGLVLAYIFGRLRNESVIDPDTIQQFERKVAVLQTELGHSQTLVAEKNQHLSNKEIAISELNVKVNETAQKLGIALDQLENLNLLRAQLQQENRDLTDQLRVLVSENATLSANISATEERLVAQKREIEDIRIKSHLEFENIANRILEVKSQKFTASNRENIEKLLEPLGKDINSFKLKVEETYEKESKQRFSLEKEVKALIEQTDKVSAEANNLATALKGQAKKQGNWGEMILERILETNGLVRGREYDVQHPIKNAEGEQQYLDVIVHLPDNRSLVIDSKVTLRAYDRYCSSEDEVERAEFLKQHLQALTTHIDQLSKKRYDDLGTSPDFVMLFVPIEPAYLTAIQNDSDLWSKAYAKRILLISPTNLMAAVKMVSDLWKRDQQSRNAIEIAHQGEKLYDKFIGFLSSLEDVGDHLAKSQIAFNKAVGQIKQGRGNLISRAEKLKELGVKSTKNLPVSMSNYDPELIDQEHVVSPKLLSADSQ